MSFFLLTAGLLLLAAACALLLAGRTRARKMQRPLTQHDNTASGDLQPAPLSPLARRHAIASYQAIQAMALPEDEVPAPAPRLQRPMRKIAPAATAVARMRWQQRQAAMSGR